MLEVRYYGLTDIGQKRKTNQDHFLIARLNKSMVVDYSSIAEDDQARFLSDAEGRLLLVADGMGGHAGGEVASHIAIDSAVVYVLNTIPWFYRLSRNCDEDFKEELKKALEFCQQQMTAETDASPQYQGMGTTLTMAYIIGRHMYVVHVGDSRCYLMRDGELHQITRDHTVAQALVDQGGLDPDAVESSPLSHVLWNAVGGSAGSDLKPDVYKCELREADRVMLCTDGLSRYLGDADMVSILNRDSAIEKQCAELVAAANAGGGSDNITVVLACFDGINEGTVGQTPNGRSEADVPSLADTDAHILLQ